MNKTVYYFASRGNNKKLVALKKINDLLNLGYDIVVVPPGEQISSRGTSSNFIYVDDLIYDSREEKI